MSAQDARTRSGAVTGPAGPTESPAAPAAPCPPARRSPPAPPRLVEPGPSRIDGDERRRLTWPSRRVVSLPPNAERSPLETRYARISEIWRMVERFRTSATEPQHRRLTRSEKIASIHLLLDFSMDLAGVAAYLGVPIDSVIELWRRGLGGVGRSIKQACRSFSGIRSGRASAAEPSRSLQGRN